MTRSTSTNSRPFFSKSERTRPRVASVSPTRAPPRWRTALPTWIHGLLSSAAASTDVSGGTNGVTTRSNIPYGAEPGTAGIVQFITGNNVLPGGDGASCVLADLAVTNVDSPDPV